MNRHHTPSAPQHWSGHLLVDTSSSCARPPKIFFATHDQKITDKNRNRIQWNTPKRHCNAGFPNISPLIYYKQCFNAGLTTAEEAASSVALQQCHLLCSGQSHDNKMSYTIQKVNVQCRFNHCSCCPFISPAAGPQISATNYRLYRLVHFKQDILGLPTCFYLS